MLRKMFQLMISLCVIYVLFISISSRSNAQDTCEAACVKIVNGQMRCVAPDATCLPSEQLMLLGSGGGGANGEDGISCWDLDGEGDCDLVTEDVNEDNVCDALDCQGPQGEQGPASCPSIIGGGGTLDRNNDRYLPYFADQQVNSQLLAQHVVEGPGSIRNLKVLNVSGSALTAGSWTVALQVNGTSTDLDCTLDSNDLCEDLADCVDVDAGFKINLLADNSTPTTPNANKDVNHTVVFNGCVCCDGLPPVDGTCVREEPE